MGDCVRQVADWLVEAQALAKCADQAVRDGNREAGAALISKLYSVFDGQYGNGNGLEGGTSSVH